MRRQRRKWDDCDPIVSRGSAAMVVMAEKRYTFTKQHRLAGREAFAAVFDGKVRQSRGPLTVYAIPTERPSPRLGLSVSRRVGTAPRRNRIKRMLREAFRLMRHDFPRAYDLVVVVRPHEPHTLAEYQKLMSSLMVKLHGAWEMRQDRQT